MDEPHPGRLHLPDQPLVHLEAPHEIENDIDVHSRPRPFRQCIGEFIRDLARPIDVGREIDGPPRLGDGLEHGREYLIAIPERLDTVAGYDARCEDAFHRLPEACIRSGMIMADHVLKLGFVGHEAANGEGKRCAEQDAGQGRQNRGSQ